MKKLLITAMALSCFALSYGKKTVAKTDYRKMVQSLYIQVYG